MIGIRREDKSKWEVRAPLTPEDVAELHGRAGVRFQLQRSEHRVFPEAEYREAGAEIVDELRDSPVILGVKEIPVERFEAGKTYLCFSHTIKGQPGNLPALRRLMELGCTLIDYERIVDERNRRLVFFGRSAGLAGMIDTFWALGQRVEHECLASLCRNIRPAHRYRDLHEAHEAFSTLAGETLSHGIPPAIQPLVIGIAGYGQVSQGAQEICDLLPLERVEAERLHEIKPRGDAFYLTVFREEHMAERIDGAPFDLQDYYQHPERYRAAFFPYVKHLTVLVNAIYWEPRYPRFLTREQLAELYSGRPRLRVIGDITCDIDGSLACTTRATDPDNPVYVYDPATGKTTDGVAGNGPVVLAVDFLPCELPVDASRHFSASLREFLPALARADLSQPLPAAGLPPELERATIVHRGELTPSYRYLESFL